VVVRLLVTTCRSRGKFITRYGVRLSTVDAGSDYSSAHFKLFAS
jgi:hypothetical protein